jgi:TPR repeat protein
MERVERDSEANAVEQATALACVTLGTMMMKGQGVERNQARGVALLEQGCTKVREAKLRLQCVFDLAAAYKEGHGVAADESKAREYVQAACEAGDTPSCVEMATACAKQRDANHAPVNYVASCFDHACGKLGHPGSCLERAKVRLRENQRSFATNRAIAADLGRACRLACDREEWIAGKKGTAGAFKMPCQSQLDGSCSNLQSLEQTIAKQAEAKLPKLFATCAANKAKIERWRVHGVEAGRRGDPAAAAEAARQLGELEPSWNQTLNDLQESISLVTGDEGPRYVTLIRQVHDRCSCGATRSGQCRR